MSRSKRTASSKASQATPLSPEELQAATNEGRYCEPCSRAFVTLMAFKAHHRQKHGPAVESTTAPAAQAAPARAAGSPATKEVVTFYSPKAAGMRVVVMPARWKRVEIAGIGSENRQGKGLVAQFENGEFRTSDPRIIAYLEKDLEACLKFGIVDDDDGTARCYNDPRFPVISRRMLAKSA